MKRFIISVIVLLALSGVFAQQSVDLKLQGTQSVQVVLRGPIPSYPVVLSLEASYIREAEHVVVVLKGDNSNDGARITEPNKRSKDQITHLFFPYNWNGFRYCVADYKGHFKDIYKSKIKLETPIRNQITKSKDSANLEFRQIFIVENGKLKDARAKDIIPLQDGKKEFEIQVWDPDKPVELTINNLIPLGAKFTNHIDSNEYTLKYISNSSTIIFNIPEDKCARKYTLIKQYEDTNRVMRKELRNLLNTKDTIDQEFIREQWQLIYKYEKTRERIDTTIECKELREQFNTFIKNYNEILDATPFTPDSLFRMIGELRSIYDSLVYGSDISFSTCQELQDKAVMIVAGLELDEEIFDNLSEAHARDLVHQFNDLKTTIDGFICPEEIDSFEEPVAEEPVSDSDPLPKPRPNTSRCNCRVITDAMTAINRLWNENELGGKLRKARYDAIVRDTDDYLRTLSTSCQQSACKTAIDQYKKAQVEYKKHFK
jgi:hypothetical protein